MVVGRTRHEPNKSFTMLPRDPEEARDLDLAIGEEPDDDKVNRSRSPKPVVKSPVVSVSLGRDIVATALGIVVALLMGIFFPHAGKVSGHSSPCSLTTPQPWSLVDPEVPEFHLHGPPSPWASSSSIFSVPVQHLTPAARPQLMHGLRNLPSYAFVQIVEAGDTHDTAKQLWRSIAMARAIKKLSQYPLLLLTNVGELPDGSNLVRRFAELDVHVLPLSNLEVQNDHEGGRFHKIGLWQISGFERLVWLDTNGILFRNIDWLFEHEEAWVALDDDSHCSQQETTNGKGTLLLLEPNGDTFTALRSAAAERSAAKHTEDEIISHYFAEKQQKPLRILQPSDAATGACLNTSLDTEGKWRMPAFVHGSSDLGRCFYFDTSSQVVKASGKEVNLCHFHALGPYWRDLFCDAVKLLAVQTGLVSAYCDDEQWYSQHSSPEEVRSVGKRKSFEICNAWALPPLADMSPAIFTVSEKENQKCYNFIKGSEQKKMTKGGRTGRNWCWEGMKEYGCHWHLWDHMTWPEMQAKALEFGNGTIQRPFFPLQNSEICEARKYGKQQDFTTTEWTSARKWFDDVVATYVLTLASSKKRTETIERHLTELDINFTVVHGFDLRADGDYEKAVKENIIPAEFNISKAQEEALLGKNNMGYIAGTVGCASGHFRVQAHAAKQTPSKPISLIFEDDVAPEKDFIPRLWRLVTQELPCDWTAVSLRSGCPYGSCLSPQLSLVLPDANEPAWRCRHGVNYGFQGMLYRTADILELQKIWKPVVFNETQPHCLDVDVALATLSDRIRYYAVPAVQAPGFLKETGQGSARWDINMAKKVLKRDEEEQRKREEKETKEADKREKERQKEEDKLKKEEALKEQALEEALAKQLEEREKQLEKIEQARREMQSHGHAEAPQIRW